MSAFMVKNCLWSSRYLLHFPFITIILLKFTVPEMTTYCKLDNFICVLQVDAIKKACKLKGAGKSLWDAGVDSGAAAVLEFVQFCRAGRAGGVGFTGWVTAGQPATSSAKNRLCHTLKYYFLPSRCSLMSLFFCSRFCALPRSCPEGRVSEVFREYSKIRGVLWGNDLVSRGKKPVIVL